MSLIARIVARLFHPPERDYFYSERNGAELRASLTRHPAGGAL